MEPPSHRPTILVVDDEPDIVDLLSLALREEGFGIRVARDGAEALACCREDRPDLILLDLAMPGVDGPTFIARYRAEAADPAPIVIVSALEQGESEARRLGVAAFTAKPFNLGELARTVRALAGSPG